MSYTWTFTISLGSIKAGLTLAAQLIDSTGAAYGDEITSGFTDLGGGNYQLVATIPDSFVGSIIYYQASAPTVVYCCDPINPGAGENCDAKSSATKTVADAIRLTTDKIDTAMQASGTGAAYQFTTDALENAPSASAGFTNAEKAQIRSALGIDGDKTTATGGQLQDIKAKTDLISAGSFTVAVTTPVLSDGTIELVQGDDYPTGGEVILTFSNYSGPSLSGASVALVLQAREDYDAGTGTAADTIAGTLAVDGTTVTCTFILTATQTAALTETTPPATDYAYVYQCIATTSAGKKRTLGLGAMTLERKAT